jgi:hypothetical protein
MRRIVIALGVIVGVFIVRAVVELLTIDYSDPSSYADDWGGPSIAGVLLVHCGLGLSPPSGSASSYGDDVRPDRARQRRRTPRDTRDESRTPRSVASSDSIRACTRPSRSALNAPCA